jgi:hypothetical protein
MPKAQKPVAFAWQARASIACNRRRAPTGSTRTDAYRSRGSYRRDTLRLDSHEGQGLLAQGSIATAPCPPCGRKEQRAEPARLAAVHPALPKGTQVAHRGLIPASFLSCAQAWPPSGRHPLATPEIRCASRSRRLPGGSTTTVMTRCSSDLCSLSASIPPRFELPRRSV